MSAPPHLIQLDVGLLANFVTLIGADDGACAVVDPAFEVDRVLAEVRRRGWRVVAILVTPPHEDHIEGVAACAAAAAAAGAGADIPVHVGAAEAAALRRHAPAARIIEVHGGETIAIGTAEVRALATPGHTLAGMTWLGDGFACTGDVLFVGSCGRSDLEPGGDPRALWRSLQLLATLPEETRIYPGHDYGPTPTSTIAWELLHNPCFRQPDEASFTRWQRLREASGS